MNGVFVTAAEGARLPLPVSPQGEYDFRVSFTRTSGQHSIALLFVHGGKMCAFEVDAWGQHLGGFQNIANQDMRRNRTRRTGITLENGRQYMLTVEVRKNRIRGLLDDREIASVSSTGRDLSLSNVWRMPQTNRLAIAASNSDTTFHSVEVRSISGPPLVVSENAVRPTPRKTGPPLPVFSPNPETIPLPPPPGKSSSAPKSASPSLSTTRKRVLIVSIGDYGLPKCAITSSTGITSPRSRSMSSRLTS